MAYAKAPDSQHIEQVRAQVGSFLNTHHNPCFAKGATFIEESFEVFELPAERISIAARSPKGISEFLLKTRRWHHQISQNGAAVGFALSGAANNFGGGWSLQAVFASRLAAKLARAIEMIDRQRPGEDTEAIYVTIPAYRVVCFLLRGYSSEEVFVVRSTNVALGPMEGKFYTAADFLEAILQTRPVRGMVMK
jgi:hypothetical protein